MDEHQHEFKPTKVDISNGQKFVTEACACGATKSYSRSQGDGSKRRSFGKINSKPEKTE